MRQIITGMEKEYMEYKISVIIPVYKVEKYLRRCVDSIINQTYRNLEIILIDDGSNDGCSAICDEYAIQDKRVKTIHKENGGLSSARNAGLENATGEIIALVDSDDYINSNMFSDMMKQFIENDADIVMCDYQYAYSDEADSKSNSSNNNPIVTIIDGKSAQYQANESYERRVTFTVAWNKLYRKELFDGITYPEGRIHEDEARTHRLLYRAKKIAYIEYPYYYYFQRQDSIVGKKVTRVNLQLIDAYLDKLEFYREHNEYELWSIEAIHAMHMMCYLNKRFVDAKADIEIVREPQWRKLCDELRLYPKAGKLKFSQKAEVHFFLICPSMYLCVWERFKK